MKNRIFSSLFSHLPLSYLLLPFLTFFLASVASAQIPSTGLVGYWPFNGNANDESGNGNNGTVNGATLTTDRFGNANSAYSFDGVNDFVDVGNSFFNNGWTNYSISCWIKATNLNTVGGNTIMNTIPHGGFALGYSYYSSNSFYHFKTSSNPGAAWDIFSHENSNANNLNFNQFHNLTLTKEGLIYKYYVDGVLDKTMSTSIAPLSIFFALKFGAIDGNTENFNGIIDDISIYNRALNPAEITQIYTDQTSTVATPPCPTLATNLQTGLVGYWPFCGNANDESGNGNNGTVNGATLTTDRFGNANSAYLFNRSTTNEINFSSSNSLNSLSNITISMWVKLNSYGELNQAGYNHLINKSDQSNNHQFVFANNSNQLYFYFAGGANSFATNNLPPLNQWSNLCLVYNYDGTIQNSYCKFYIDGILVETFPTTQSLNIISENLKIGSFGQQSYNRTDGAIDEVQIWNRPLSSLEVSQLSTDATAELPIACTPFLGEDQTVCAGTSVTLSASSTSSSVACPALPSNLQTGLVGYWPFCGNANDASGNGNNGTVNGATLTTDRFGNLSGAYSFSGVNCCGTPDPISEISITNPFLFLGSDFTVSCWMSSANIQKYQQCLFNSINHTGFAVELNNEHVPSRLTFAVGPANAFWDFLYAPGSNTNYSNNQWYNVSFVKSGTTYKMYLNGQLDYSTAIGNSSNYNQTVGLRIGSIGGGHENFMGKLDDYAVWNRALTNSELQEYSNLTFSGNQNGILWSNGATTPTIDVSPTSTTTYTCTVTTNGVSCTDTVTVVVSNPVVDLGADVTVCGTSRTLTAPSGFDSYLWSNGGTTNTTTVSANGTYSCTVTQGGCNATDSIDVALIDATITASDSIICAGETVSLSSTQGDQSSNVLYRIRQISTNTHAPRTSTIKLFDNGAEIPSINYSVTSNFTCVNCGVISDPYPFGYSNNCSDQGWILTNNGIIQFQLNTPNQITSLKFYTVWSGCCRDAVWAWEYFDGTDWVTLDNINYNATGCGEYSYSTTPAVVTDLAYSWSNGATTPIINVSPTSTTTYTCTVTANGVSCTDSVTVVVNNPAIDLGTDVTVCGTSTTLTAPSGYDSYLWNNGGTTNTTTVSSNGTYSCTGLLNGCSVTDSIDVVLVSLDAQVNVSSICAGEAIELTATSNLSVNQNSNCIGNTGSPNPWPYPSAYDAGIIDLGNFGAQSVFSISAWVNVGATQNGVSILMDASHGGSANWVVQAFGNNTYTWGSLSFTLTPNVWQHVLLTYVNGSKKCFIDGQLVASVYNPISYSGSPQLYLGNWPEGGRRFNGLVDELYITYSELQSSNFVPAQVVNAPSANSFGLWHFDEGANGTTLNSVNGNVAQIGSWFWASRPVVGNATISWNGVAGSSTQTLSPVVTTTYVSSVLINGLTCSDSVTVVVSNPVIDLGADVTVCGTSTTLTAPSGYDSYLWSNGGTTNTTTVTANGTYSCTVTQGGCSVTDAVDVTLIDATITASDSIVCAGETVTLSVPQGGSTSTACAALPTNLQTGLVGYWPFCGNANDASGNGNNGSVNGAALTTDRFGSANGAYSFDGYNDLIRVPHQPNLNLLGDYSISVWLEGNFQNLFNNNWVLIAKRDDGGTCCSPNVPYDFFIPFNSTNYAVPGMAYANGGYSFATPPNNITVPLAGWQNVIITNSSDNLNFFVNGNLVYTTNFPSSLRLPNTSDLLIGSVNREFGAEWMSGKLDDIGTWSRALTAEEIQQLYTLGQTTYLWSNGATTPTLNVSPTSTTTYTCTVTTNGVSCTDSVTVVVSQPVASITPNGIVEICQGQSIALTANGGVSYLWNTGAPAQSITVNTEAVYTVTVTDANGCTDTESQLVKVNFLPSIGVNNASICSGQSATLTATGGLTYVWSPATGLSSTTGTTVTASPSTSTVYTVTGTGANGCTNTATAAVSLNAAPTATITPATATTFCQGGSVVLNANTGTGLSYQWFNNAVAISGATISTYTANASGSYTVVVTNTSACSATSTATIVTVNALPTATITPATATTFCQGGSVVLNANTGAGLSYQWRLNGTNISGAISSSYTATASGSYTVVVTTTSTCSSTSTATVVTVNTLPTATITPATATTFCQGGSVVLNANTGTGLSYQWFNNATAITGATTSSYTANASGSYTVVVTNTSTCAATSSATVVTVNALPTATITPATATTFCQGGSVVLNANTGAGLSYQWFNNAVAISGATSSSYTANASGSYTVVVTNTSTCSATSTATVVTVNAIPTATITPATATTFCQGGSVVLNANTGAGLSYQWFSNAVAISGATTSAYTANASGSYTVVVTNTSACSSTSTATVVTVNALPTATITPATATTFCQGGSVVLNANAGTGLTYQWRLNGTNITGATTSSYTANASGSYTVVVTNTSTCSATSTATVVTVNALPAATITPATATTFCQGGSVVLNANTGTGLSYQWRLNGNPISGATSSSYTANASGSYTVVVTNTSTCSATSTATVVTVNALPTATITPATATTFCQGGSVVLNANTGAGLSYQWFSNAVAISGATTSAYTANASGSYTVVVTNTSACSSTSTATVVTVIPNVDYFADVDGDGFGDAATLLSTCVQPQGYVTDNTDCDDTSADVNPAATEICNHIDDDCSGTIDDGLVFDTYYADVDGDTFGDANNSIYECSQPSGYVTNNTDCNDNNVNQNSSSAEICNGEDDDCDGTIDNGLIFLDYYSDLDSDGFGAGATTNSCVDLGAGYVTNNTDCNDNNANQNTASTEICNGEDDDCDGTIDNGITFLDYYADADGDGFGAGDVTSSCSDLGAGYVTNNTDCDDTNVNTNPNATETCNTIDDNCDGQIDEGVQTVYFIDNDGDTYGNPSVSILACTQPIGYTPDDNDCNDTDANINPGAEDIGGNGIDENCDGEIDNGIFELNATISLYPNPTRSELNIQVNSSIIGNDLYIFDAVGKLVYNQQLLSTQITVPVSNFADGNYVLRVGEVVKRFVVQK